MKTAANHYFLQVPVSLSAALDGNMVFSVTLVDQNGKTINVSSPAAPGTGLSSQRVSGLAETLPADDVSDLYHTPPTLTDMRNPRNLGRISPPADGCGGVGQGFVVGGAFVAVGALAMLAVLEFAPILVLGAVLAGEEAALGAALFAGIGSIAGGAGWCFFADPYFIVADSRTNADAVNPAPLQITRVTGGLVAAPRTNPAASTTAGSVSTGNESPNVQYRDNANIFVGGALPQGATAIGDWNWDPNRTFGGAPSHTQPRSDGSQLHYFIHASQPLTVGSGEELVQYVYPDPQNPPSEVYMQFYFGDGDGEHRAYWGQAQVQTGGKSGTASLYPLGALPDKGGWVRLRIPADKLGLIGQPITWDGADANGKPVPAGDYLIKLSAQTAGGGEPFERFASARVLDATTLGSIQISINQWANTPLAQVDGLHVQVYPQGSRIHPAAQVDNDASPAFTLPAGQYDILVGLSDLRRELDGVALGPGKTATASIDLELGALQVTLLAAPGSPVNGIASVQVSRSGDPTQAPAAVQNTGVSNFVLPPGLYDVQAEYQGVHQFIYGVRVETGQTAQQEIDLGAGSLQLNVLAFGGQPAQAGGRLTVQAFSPQDHKTPLATDYNNPAKLLLPAGSYDIQVTYAVAAPSPNTLGSVEQWLNGIAIQSGGTVTQDYDLRLGEVKLDILEAAGKPADPKNINLTIYPHGDSSNSAAGTIAVNTATFQLLPGSYDVVADYANTNLDKLGPIATFQATPEQSTVQTIDLKLGRIEVQVYDASGQLVDGNRLGAQVYPAGKRDVSFAFAYSANPLELAVLSDTAYDVVVSLDDKKLELTGQSVKEGETPTLKLNANDFK